MRQSAERERGQIGVIGVAISLGVVAILTAVIMGIALEGGNGGTDTAGNGAVGIAGNVQAQTALSQAASAAREVGTASLATLQTAEPSVSFVSGPSTSPNVISVAIVPGAPTGTGGGGDIGGLPGVAVPGATNSGAAAGATGANVTLAAYSPVSKTCWFVYSGSGDLWYGAQTNQTACVAPSLSGPPAASGVSDTAIGWQQNQFPVV